MSNLASFSVINQKIEKIFREEEGISKGVAFSILSLQTLFKLTEDEIEESITDGPMDGEVDAIYINDRVINIMTFKYTDNFKLSQKNYPESELDQFILTVDLIISGNLDKKSINNAVWEKYEEIRNLASSGKIEFKIYVVSNKMPPVDHAKEKLKKCIDKYKIVDSPIYLDQESIVSKILEGKSTKYNGQVKFIDRQHFEKSDGNIKTVIGSIAATDLVELIKKSDDEINEAVFNENVRVYKPRHRVNKAIIETANSSDNFQFFYLNNGVTILCEGVDYAPNTRSPLATMENFQIINGGQTSHSLFEVFKENPEKLETIELLVRICEAKKDNPLSEKISETSNNQIPVGNRDLHANDLIQKKLEEDFKTQGLYYERKPGQFSEQPRDKVFNNEVLGQLFMSYHLEMPSEAKNSKRKVFSDLYDQIFDDMIINADELIRLHKLYKPLLNHKKEIQRKKRRKEEISEKDAFISRAIFHIVCGTRYFFEQAISEINQKDITEKEKKSEISKIYTNLGEKYTNEVIEIIYQVVENEMELRGDLYTHDKFFKETPTNSIIKTNILKEINNRDSLL